MRDLRRTNAEWQVWKFIEQLVEETKPKETTAQPDIVSLFNLITLYTRIPKLCKSVGLTITFTDLTGDKTAVHLLYNNAGNISDHRLTLPSNALWFVHLHATRAKEFLDDLEAQNLVDEE